MKFNFENLDQQTRDSMLAEIQFDIDNEKLYYSNRLSENGKKLYPQLLVDSVTNGNEETLALALKNNNCFVDKESRNGKNGITYAKVPETANQTLAEGEFNRFYIRGIAMRAINSGQTLTVYRAKYSENPRQESEIMIGQKVDATKLLEDLRTTNFVDRALGLPPGPNSGLSVKLS